MDQVNVSYDCQMNALSRRQQLDQLSMEQKRAIFQFCCDETEQLIASSVLGPFYGSNEFALLQQRRLNVLPHPTSPSNPSISMMSRSTTSPVEQKEFEIYRSKTPMSPMVSPVIAEQADSRQLQRRRPMSVQSRASRLSDVASAASTRSIITMETMTVNGTETDCDEVDCAVDYEPGYSTMIAIRF